MEIDLFFQLAEPIQDSHSYLHPEFDIGSQTTADLRIALGKAGLEWGLKEKRKDYFIELFREEIWVKREQLIKGRIMAFKHPRANESVAPIPQPTTPVLTTRRRHLTSSSLLKRQAKETSGRMTDLPCLQAKNGILMRVSAAYNPLCHPIFKT